MLKDALIFSFLLILNFFAFSIYVQYASKNRIVSSPNFRTLHEGDALTGGGIVFAIIFVIAVIYYWVNEALSDGIFFVFGLGACFATIFGFFDDIFNITAIKKLLVYILLSSWSVYWLDVDLFSNIVWLPNFLSMPFALFFIIWSINAFNFIDGIDGLAISISIFVSIMLIILILLLKNSSEMINIYLPLLACTLGFLFFNWPPAKIFMGDSGSIFLGYAMGSIILVTIDRGELSIWTWLTILAYFISDTTVTQLARLIIVKKWYRAHRSHAYQNLARILNSHFKVTFGILIYHILWIFPLTIWTVLEPSKAIYAVILAVFPATLYAIRYGPLESSS